VRFADAELAEACRGGKAGVGVYACVAVAADGDVPAVQRDDDDLVSVHLHGEGEGGEVSNTSRGGWRRGGGGDVFPTRRFELNHIVKRKLKMSLSDGQIERARQIFSHFDYVPQTKITFRASSPYGNTRNFLLNVRVMGSQIINDTFVGLSKLDFVKTCMISLSGTTATLRIAVKGSKSR